MEFLLIFAAKPFLQRNLPKELLSWPLKSWLNRLCHLHQLLWLELRVVLRLQLRPLQQVR
jgi:hypothetical protein